MLLINPLSMGSKPNTQHPNYFPLGLLSLATVLKHNGIEARIIDVNNNYYMKEVSEKEMNNYIEKELYNCIDDYTPDIIGIGGLYSGTFGNLKLLAQRIKDRYPAIPIVTGGVHSTIFAKDILKQYSYIDYVIIGEGEETFLGLVKSLLGGNRAFEDINGIAFRRNGDIKLNPKTEFIKELDELPFIDYSFVPIEKYYNMDTSNWYSPKGIEINQPFPILSGRGCPNRCTFCSMRLVHGQKIRFRSPANVLDEMERLYNDYDVRYFNFMDDNLTFDKKQILEICHGIVKRKMNIQFDTPNGIALNKLDKEIIDAMVAAGMVRVCIAIESGSEYIRNKVMKKNLSTAKIYESVEALARYNHLFISAFLIIGMPEETHETLEETYKMIKNLPNVDKFSVFFITPYPGTELFDYCMEHNLLPHKVEDYVSTEDLHHAAEYPHFKPYKLTINDLLDFQKKCQNYFEERRKHSNIPRNFPLRYKITNKK